MNSVKLVKVGLLTLGLSLFTPRARAAKTWAPVVEPFVSQHIGWRPAQYAVKIMPKQYLHTGGIVLQSDLYIPNKKTPSPTLLIRIPLDQNDTGQLFSELMGYFFAQRGYNVLIQGVRGRYGSGGQHWPFRHEREDGLATLAWLKTQHWHNGVVGMWGGSYFGYTQWVLSDQQDFGLQALAIQIASSDHHQFFFPGGALAYETALFWATRSHSEIDTPLTHEQLLEAMKSGPPRQADQRTLGKPVPFYQEWLDHPRKDAYWQTVDGQNRVLKANVPTLLMAGWYDPFLPSQLADYKLLQKASPLMAHTSRLIIGPWSHAQTMRLPDGFSPQHYRLASIAPVLDWYDHHLMQRKLHKFKPVQAFVSGVNQWLSFEAWPPKRSVSTPFYLQHQKKSGQLRKQAPKLSAQLSYVHDPSNPVPSEGGAILISGQSGPVPQTSQKRADVLGFQSDVLKSPLTLIGEASADLWLSSSAPSADVVVKVMDVHPDGTAYGISQGIFRGEFEPGKPRQVLVKLWGIGHSFLKGHRLRVEVASSHFPMFSVHPGTAEDPLTATKTKKSLQTLLMGGAYPSHIDLPLHVVTQPD